MRNSTIKIKPCKCGCGKPPKMGYAGYGSLECVPQEIKDADPERFKKSHITRLKRSNLANISRKLHMYQKEKNKPSNSLKSASLKKADSLFSKFIRKRDADAKGNIKCPCCRKTYHVTDKNGDGELIIQTLHFVPRSVYSRRYCPNNAVAGCCYCNKKQHDDPYGDTYQKFKEFLYIKIGVEAVWMMEAEKRNINKLTQTDLEEIIKKYTVNGKT